MAADVYTEPPHVGRGGWTWYTGSAGWMYQAGVESILGLPPARDDARCSIPASRAPGRATRSTSAITPPGTRSSSRTRTGSVAAWRRSELDGQRAGGRRRGDPARRRRRHAPGPGRPRLGLGPARRPGCRRRIRRLRAASCSRTASWTSPRTSASPWTCLALPWACCSLSPVSLPSPSSTLPSALVMAPLVCSSVMSLFLRRRVGVVVRSDRPARSGRSAMAAPMNSAGAAPAAVTSRGAPASLRPAARPTELAVSQRSVESGSRWSALVVRRAPAPRRAQSPGRPFDERSRGRPGDPDGARHPPADVLRVARLVDLRVVLKVVRRDLHLRLLFLGLGGCHVCSSRCARR